LLREQNPSKKEYKPECRRTKKLLAKSNWFRNEQEEDCNEIEREYRYARPPTHSAEERGKNNNTGKQSGAKLITSTVMFVEFSKGGSLQKCMKDVLDRIAPMMGFKVRVTEKGGSTLGSLLSNKNLWRGSPVGERNVELVLKMMKRKNHVPPGTLSMKVSVQ
jgi:hypothetical protein